MLTREPIRLDDDFGEPSALRHFLFREASDSPAALDVVRWWEGRRLRYNLIVGATGLFTLASVTLMSVIGPRHPGPPPAAFLFVPVIYGLVANVMYTTGWVAELLVLRKLFGRKTPVVGATLFRYGLAFSVGLTLLPNVIFGYDLAIRLVRWIFGA